MARRMRRRQGELSRAAFSQGGADRRFGTHVNVRDRMSVIHRPQPATGRTRSEPRILLI